MSAFDGIERNVAAEKLSGVVLKEPPKEWRGWPDDKPKRYNACTDPCDMWEGPCCCGAWHKDGV